jgi:hypothetical protein
MAVELPEGLQKHVFDTISGAFKSHDVLKSERSEAQRDTASLLLLFAVIAGGVACVEAIRNGEYLAAIAFAAITLTCAVGFSVPLVSRRVRQWWW